MSKQFNDIIPSQQSILYIDIGNTSLKAAYKEGVHWHHPDSTMVRNAADLVKWVNHHEKDFELTVVCSVVPKTTEALKEGLQTQQLHIFSAADIPRDLLQYESPQTLGIDRFFACYGAISHTKKSAVVIDAGTACTIDYMSADFIFMGGVITPGMGTLEKALEQYAPILPSVTRTLPSSWPGKTTESSIQWGLVGAFRDSIEAALMRYEEHYGEFDLAITGGDADWLASLLSREAKIRPNLIFEGMYRFLEDHGSLQ